MRGHLSVVGYGLVWMLLVTEAFILSFELGVENISSQVINTVCMHDGIPSRIGLITNQTGRDQHGNRTVDILRQKGLHIVYILAPEHGFEGTHPAGKPVAHTIDLKTGIPIMSLYGAGGDTVLTGKCLDPVIMRQLDLLIYDIQDSGMRHYTYISTLLCALDAAAQHDKPIIILDRPNFLGAFMEGPLVDPYPQLKSFISIAPIPLRHGMTVGELARYFNKYLLPKRAQLHVVPMKDYRRTMTPPFLSSLSPNIASLSSLYGYSFLGILGEVEPFNTGVGTPYAFQTIMLPDVTHITHEWAKIKTILAKHNIHSVAHTGLKNHKTYSGLRLIIPDGKKVVAFELLIDLLLFFKAAGVRLSYSATFDKAVGTNKVQSLCNGSYTKKELRFYIHAALEQFFTQARDCYLYEPLPEIKELS